MNIEANAEDIIYEKYRRKGYRKEYFFI